MEIGGYFGLEEFTGTEYYPDLVALNTGRNALAYLIRTKRIMKLYIPTYLCDSIYKLCEREGCVYEFYEIREDFQPIFNKTLGINEWLYVVNYYGQVTNEVELKEKYDRIIFDNVQAFFQIPVDGIDTIYSCRKFFGVPDGAYLATDKRIELPVDTSKNRMTHILGRFEGTASEYYRDFNINDESFYNLEPKFMSRLTHNILRIVDYEAIKRKREDNFIFLHKYLGNKNRLKIKSLAGPYVYPFYVKDGMIIKRKLATKQIYIPTLWPNAIEIGGLAKEYSTNILPLPVDQRYGYEEMKLLIKNIISEYTFS